MDGGAGGDLYLIQMGENPQVWFLLEVKVFLGGWRSCVNCDGVSIFWAQSIRSISQSLFLHSCLVYFQHLDVFLEDRNIPHKNT